MNSETTTIETEVKAIETANAPENIVLDKETMAVALQWERDINKRSVYQLMVNAETLKTIDDSTDNDSAKRQWLETLNQFLKSMRGGNKQAQRATKNGKALARVQIATIKHPTNGLMSPIFGDNGLTFELALDRWYFGALAHKGVNLEGMKQAKGFIKVSFEVSAELQDNGKTWYTIHNLSDDELHGYATVKEIAGIVKSYVDNINAGITQSVEDIEKQKTSVSGYSAYVKSK